MQKFCPVEQIPSCGISMMVRSSAGDLKLLDGNAEVNISCGAAISPGLCIDLCEQIPQSGKNVSISAAADTVYNIVEALAAGFTTVVYGFIRKICRKAVRAAGGFRRIRVLPVRCRMAQLAFAGGLRL